MIDWWGPILMEYYAGSEGVGMTKIGSADWLQHPGSVGRAAQGHAAHRRRGRGENGRSGETGLDLLQRHLPPFAVLQGAGEDRRAHHCRRVGRRFGDVGHVDADGYLYPERPAGRHDHLRRRQPVPAGDRGRAARSAGRVGRAPSSACPTNASANGRWPSSCPQRSWTPPTPTRCSRRCRRTANNLGRFKRPAVFHLLAELPRSPTGKLLRRKLRDLLPKEKLA
jgi:long-chain acyl-CoA synthetase